LVPYDPRIKLEAPQLTLGEPQSHFPSDFTTTTVTTSRSESTTSVNPQPLDLADGPIPANLQRVFQFLCEEGRKRAREERSMETGIKAQVVASHDNGIDLVHKTAYCDAGPFLPTHLPPYSTIVPPATCFLPMVEKDDTHDTSSIVTGPTDYAATTPTSSSTEEDDAGSYVTGQTTPDVPPVFFDSLPGFSSFHVNSTFLVSNVTRNNNSHVHAPTLSVTTPTSWSNASTPYSLMYQSPHPTPPPASPSPSVNDRDIDHTHVAPYHTIPRFSFNSFYSVHDPIKVYHLEFQVHYVLCELENIVIRDAGEHGYARLRDFPASLYSRFDPYYNQLYILRGTFRLLRQRVSDLRHARRLLLDLKDDIGATLTPGQVRECNDPLCQIFYFDNGICEFTNKNRYEFFVQRAPACNPLLTHQDIAFFRTATGFLRICLSPTRTSYDDSSTATILNLNPSTLRPYSIARSVLSSVKKSLKMNTGAIDSRPHVRVLQTKGPYFLDQQDYQQPSNPNTSHTPVWVHPNEVPDDQSLEDLADRLLDEFNSSPDYSSDDSTSESIASNDCDSAQDPYDEDSSQSVEDHFNPSEYDSKAIPNLYDSEDSSQSEDSSDEEDDDEEYNPNEDSILIPSSNFGSNTEGDPYAFTMYKRVDKKIKPVPGVFPQEAR
ncbi:hypothetical protein BV22DRAFT_1052619, partial [Leucogyrophana mollusca]